ncbi:MAG: methyl-accepting chemotaxis protein [Candidatus Dormibacteria bacterium]|jgi:methyl-accepting chemotaxis protein
MLKSAGSRFDRLQGSYFTRFVSGVLAICVVVMGSMVLLLGNIAEGSLTTSTSDGVQSVAQEVASKVDSWVEDRERELTQLASIMSASGTSTAQSAIELISKATAADPFVELELVNESGVPLASTGSGGAVSLAEQSWVQGIYESNAPFVGDVALNSAGNDLQWLMAVPASTSTLQFSGLLVGFIGLEPWTGPGGGSNQVASLLSGVTGTGGTGTSVTAVDSAGLLVYTTQMGSSTKLTSAQMLAKGALRTRIDNAAVVAALEGRSGSARLPMYQKDTITGYAEAPDIQWAILVSEPASQALGGVDALRNSGWVVLVAGLVLAALFSFGMAQLEVRPIRALSRAARRVSSGDLTARVSPSGAEEVATLGEAFNLMVARLESLITRVQGTSTDLSDSAIRLAAASNQLAATTARQSSSATETSASMEELARTSGQIAETVERVASQAAETRDKLERAREDILASTERTLSLTDRVRDITRILSMINDLADQTNLLALNAAIEAARAGEAGRGFAVVADEVRRLADRSKTLASDISQITANVQVETNATVLAMDKGAEQLKDGLVLMEHVAEASSGIRLATQQQQSATEQVVEAMEQVRIASQQVSTTAQELALASGSQATMAGDLKQVSTVAPPAPSTTGRHQKVSLPSGNGQARAADGRRPGAEARRPAPPAAPSRSGLPLAPATAVRAAAAPSGPPPAPAPPAERSR